MNKVFTTWDTVEAGFVRSLLESNGITCFVRNLHLSSIALTGSGAAPITVLVGSRDRQKAEEIVAQYYRDLNDK